MKDKNSDTARIENLQVLFKPLAEFLIQRSLKIQPATEALKAALVQSAVKSLEQNDEKITVAKVSVMTGLHRRDVDRLMDGNVGEKTSNIDLITKIVGIWSLNKKYLDKQGRPRPLLFDGNKSEFAKLVFQVSKELKPSTILFEMQRSSLVDAKGELVSLSKNYALSLEDEKESLALLSSDIKDLILAVNHNIHQEEETPSLHAKTEFDQIPISLFPEIKRWLLDRGTKHHEEVRKYLSQFDQDINPQTNHCDEAKGRVAYGSFAVAEHKGKDDEDSN